MAVRYNKLWKLLIDKNMSKIQLIKAAGISTNAMAKLGKNQDVRVEIAHIQITTTTFDDALATRYEKASLPSKRVEAIETLQRRGFDTFFCLSPYVEGWIDFDKLNAVQWNVICQG